MFWRKGLIFPAGTDTIPNYRQVIETVEYSNTLDIPSQGRRTITCTIYDTLSQRNTSQTTMVVTALPAPPPQFFYLPLIRKER